MATFVLGSQSSARKLLFSRLGHEFQTMAADIDEQAIRSEDFERLPLLLAHAKADALLPRVSPDAILITCDQVVVCNGALREKPATAEQARHWIAGYAASPAQTNSAVVVHNVAAGRRVEGLDIARVYFRALPPDAVQELLDEGNVQRSAGAFLIEDHRFLCRVERMDGDIDSIMGMPLTLTARLIREATGRRRG